MLVPNAPPALSGQPQTGTPGPLCVRHRPSSPPAPLASKKQAADYSAVCARSYARRPLQDGLGRVQVPSLKLNRKCNEPSLFLVRQHARKPRRVPVAFHSNGGPDDGGSPFFSGFFHPDKCVVNSRAQYIPASFGRIKIRRRRRRRKPRSSRGLDESDYPSRLA